MSVSLLAENEVNKKCTKIKHVKYGIKKKCEWHLVGSKVARFFKQKKVIYVEF